MAETPTPLAPSAPTIQQLPWQAWVIIAMLGAGTSGVFGANITASASASDLQRVEAKVDALADKVADIKLAIARAHPEITP